jgi:drug/metabolite transporter (DMT)-like permease
MPWANSLPNAQRFRAKRAADGPLKKRAVSWRSWVAFAALGIMWGVPYYLIKVAVQELSPWVIAWGRVSLAACILLPIAWRRGALRSLGRHKLALFAFALVEFVVPLSVIALGEQWISSSITGILIATVPLWVILLSRFFGVREPVGAWRLAGLALGFIGVVALLGLGTISGVLGWAGVACMLAASVGYAIGPLIIQRHLDGLDAFGPLAASLVIASVVLLIPAALAMPGQLPAAVTLASIAILGVVCTAMAMLLMFYLVSNAGASRASLITYVNPAVATLLGVWLLHEHLGLGGITAFALILLGSWLATRGARQRNEAREALT